MAVKTPSDGMPCIVKWKFNFSVEDVAYIFCADDGGNSSSETSANVRVTSQKTVLVASDGIFLDV
jgi:hypothetical protein